MRSICFLFITIMVFNFQGLFSQTSGWMPVTRITNSKTQDRHPSMSQRDMDIHITAFSSELVFDRTDSIGTNICAITCVSGNWSREIQYITTGSGIKEYPSVGDSIIIFHNRTDKYSNLYYCYLVKNGWSKPIQLTYDTNKHNLYPKVYAYPAQLSSYKIITWEKDKKIYFKYYNDTKWSEEKQISPNDTFEYSNPDISFDSKNPIVFEKKINESNIHIILARTDGDYVAIDTVCTQGLNRNPKFVNGWGQYISWENKTSGNWQILGRKTDTYDSRHYYFTYLSDSVYNYNQFTGFFMDMPCHQSEKYYSKDEININDLYSVVNCIYIRSNVNSRSLILDGRYSMLTTNHKNGKNGAISRFRAIGGNRTWAVWETEEDGYTNLYGSYENLFPTKAEEYTKPFEFSLNQNYPNPFNPSTVISFQLTVYSKVTLKIFDILGRQVRTLIDEYKPAGEHKVIFDAKELGSGIYFYKLDAGGKTLTRKMILIR